MKFQRTLLAAVMMSTCALIAGTEADARGPAPQMDALTAARTADISLFWVETETPGGHRAR